MTSNEAKQIVIDFSFLGEGNFNAKILKDGANSDRIGTDYLFENMQVNKTSKLTLKMEKGGGFVISVKK
jgi:alpha-glucosidase